MKHGTGGGLRLGLPSSRGILTGNHDDQRVYDTMRLYKVLPEEDWRQAILAGLFSGCGIDQADGFIHLSTDEQVVETVKRHFNGQQGLLIVEIDPAGLGETLRWEASRGGELFPHVYGDIPVSAAVRVEALPIAEDGGHIFPAGMPSA